MKIALFLGAGASVPYGMPTTAGLRGKMRSIVASPPLKGMEDASEFPDVEHILSVADQMISFAESRAGQLYSRHDASGMFSDSVAKSRSFKESLEEAIFDNYRWRKSYDSAAAMVLGQLFNLARSEGDQKVTVFTTNFDTVVEEYCARSDKQIERIDGFNTRPPGNTPVWDGEYAPKDDSAHTWVFLYKLHGSMSWLKRDLDGRPSIVQKPDERASGNPDHDMFIRPSLDVKDKATASAPYATIMGKFVNLLPNFDVCIAIGYSFRDAHITEKLVDFIRGGKTLVALSPTAAADFCEHALGKPPTPAQRLDWKDKQLCHMKYLSETRLGHFYAVHDGVENVDASRLKLIMQNAYTPHYLGLIPPAAVVKGQAQG